MLEPRWCGGCDGVSDFAPVPECPDHDLDCRELACTTCGLAYELAWVVAAVGHERAKAVGAA